ncbi:MAG: cysteine hydrolase family protein [Pseudomonadota bacterium]
MQVLVLIDWQTGFRDLDYWGNRNNPDALENARRLLAGWRGRGWPVIHVRHDSEMPQSRLHPDHPGNGFEEFALPQADEPVYAKNVNSAFIGTTLEADLRMRGMTHLVLCGISTDHCVNTTARMAGNLGFDVTLAADACYAFDRKAQDGTVIPAQTVHDVHLASLKGEFAKIRNVDDILMAVQCD